MKDSRGAQGAVSLEYLVEKLTQRQLPHNRRSYRDCKTGAADHRSNDPMKG